MPSEGRLHPASILFEFAGLLRTFAVPGLLVLFTARSTGGASGPFQYMPANWEVWAMLLLLPNAAVSVARYWSFRIRYDQTELIIRSGILFKNERHIPYLRIQNLDAVQKPLHRLLGVVEVRLETGGGQEPEARMSVLSVAAFDDMRSRVFGGRAIASDSIAARRAHETSAPAVEAEQVLLQLSPRELLLHGFIENRGLIVIGAAYGLLWETGAFDAMWERIAGGETYGGRIVRDVGGEIVRGRLPLRPLAFAVVGVVGLLVFVRLLSMVWALVRLYDFRVSRVGDDLRTGFGLLTRVAATIPVGRVQTLTITEGFWHRLFERASIRVETAGGSTGGGGAGERAWLAPIVPRAAVPAFIRLVLPEIDLDALAWRPVHPRAFRRAVKPALAIALLVTTVAAVLGGWRAGVVACLTIPWAVFATRQRIRHLLWAETDDAVLLRRGWIRQYATAARVAKVQLLAVHESPFDRRTGMARLRVDTAGAGEFSHRVDIPYLPRETALELGRRLAARAGQVQFRW
jgi:putative membrane protein